MYAAVEANHAKISSTVDNASALDVHDSPRCFMKKVRLNALLSYSLPSVMTPRHEWHSSDLIPMWNLSTTSFSLVWLLHYFPECFSLRCCSRMLTWISNRYFILHAHPHHPSYDEYLNERADRLRAQLHPSIKARRTNLVDVWEVVTLVEISSADRES